MRIRITRRPPCSIVYMVHVGTVHEVTKVRENEDGHVAGYYILPAPHTKQVLVMTEECEVLRDSTPSRRQERARP